MIANTNPSELQAVKERLEALAIKYDESAALVAKTVPGLGSRHVDTAADLRALLLSHSEMEGAHFLGVGKMVSALTRRVERLKGALNGARVQFLAYAAQHDAKGTPEGAIKAVINRDWAETLRSALNEDQDHG